MGNALYQHLGCHICLIPKAFSMEENFCVQIYRQLILVWAKCKQQQYVCVYTYENIYTWRGTQRILLLCSCALWTVTKGITAKLKLFLPVKKFPLTWESWIRFAQISQLTFSAHLWVSSHSQYNYTANPPDKYNTGDLLLLPVSWVKLTGLQEDRAQAFSVFVQHRHLVEASLDSSEVTALLQHQSCSAKELVWRGKSCRPPVTKNELASSTYKLLRYQTGIPCCSFFFILIHPHKPTLKRVLEINVFTSALTGRFFRAAAGGQWFSIVKCKQFPWLGC